MKLSEEMLAFLETASSTGEPFEHGQANATSKWLPFVRDLEAGAPSRSEVQAFARLLAWLLGLDVRAETIAVHVDRGEGTATITLDVDDQLLSCVVQRTQRPEATQPLNVKDWGYWA